MKTYTIVAASGLTEDLRPIGTGIYVYRMDGDTIDKIVSSASIRSGTAREIANQIADTCNWFGIPTN